MFETVLKRIHAAWAIICLSVSYWMSWRTQRGLHKMDRLVDPWTRWWVPMVFDGDTAVPLSECLCNKGEPLWSDDLLVIGNNVSGCRSFKIWNKLLKKTNAHHFPVWISPRIPNIFQKKSSDVSANFVMSDSVSKKSKKICLKHEKMGW